MTESVLGIVKKKKSYVRWKLETEQKAKQFKIHMVGEEVLGLGEKFILKIQQPSCAIRANADKLHLDKTVHWQSRNPLQHKK